MDTRARVMVGAGLLVAVAAGVGLWALLPSGSGAPRTGATMDNDGAITRAPGQALVGLEGLDTTQVTGALPPELEGTKIEFAEAVKDTLWSYSLEDVQDYFDWQRDQGILPTPKLVDDPDFAQRVWDSGRSIIAQAQFEPESVRSRRIIDRAKVDYPKGEYWAKRDITRDDGRPFLASGEHFSFEVILRGHFPGTANEGTVVADLGLEMTWDRTAGHWVVTAMRFYHPGPPGGTGDPVNFDGSPAL